MFYVYILESEKDGKLYIGQTNNLDRRIKRHNAGEVKATRHRRPFKLKCYKLYSTRHEAMKMERYLKSLKGNEKFKSIVRNWGLAKW